MDSDKIRTGLEHIFTNWRYGVGPCKECPVRDENHHTEPYFADGILNADIALIAETPGGERDTQNGPYPDLPTRPDGYVQRQEPNKDAEFGSISNEFDLISNNRIPTEFFQNASASFNPDDNRASVYYTNTKKCKDIGGDESWKNDGGYMHCRSYIIPELDLVSPKTVIPLGENAVSAVFNEFEIGQVGKLKNYIPLDFDNNLKTEEEDVIRMNDYNIVPSYHWIYINKSCYNRSEYWAKIGSVVGSVT